MAGSEMEKVYNPREIEVKWQEYWADHQLGHAKTGTGKPPYSIVIPPPNVTAVLHLGHALNNTIQDILIRFRRMQGCEAEWMPGTDHAGIATQNVVERKLLREQGKTRQDVGRDEFVREVWKFREETGGAIIGQLKRMGCSCDWDRERFTMDEGLSRAVTEVFVRLYEKGLIYRGRYIINWCPRCQTALSDEEAEHEERKGNLWFIRYPAKDGSEGLVVATTRPETMLGDVAVAVNPADSRYTHLLGKTLVLPLVGREIPVIADDFVDPAFGTGAVKVTPAHDPNDFEMGRRHNLEPIIVMHGDGTMNAAAGEFEGLTREAARKKVVERLTELGLLVEIRDHVHSVGHCYRCHTITEPYLSNQWFVRMKTLAEPAIQVVNDGRVRFHPDRWTKVYLNWMENIRDWCISRQLWWGHRIPVWYCGDCGEVMASREPVSRCTKCGSAKVTQDPDVLDTWFSSWLWPFSTFGWPDKTPELDAFYPTNTLSTAPEIIFFWVARMIMAGMEFMGDIPFSDVYLHGTVRDDKGRKMSKSLGNGVDPLEVIESHGADAMRFSMIVITAQGQDVFISYDSKTGQSTHKGHNTFDIGRNFANKIWNATRLLMSLSDGMVPRADSVEPDLADRWIRSRYNHTVGQVTEALESFRFNDAARMLYDFIWHDLCDWYLEIIKPRVAKGGDEKASVLRNAAEVLAGSMKLLHPIMPFLTEEVWAILTEALGERDAESVMVSAWPVVDNTRVSDAVERDMEMVQSLIGTIRNIRSEMNVPLGQKADVTVVPADEDAERVFAANRGYILDLSTVAELTLDRTATRPPKSAAGISDRSEVFVRLEGLVDFDRERARLAKEVDRRRGFITSIEAKLANESFVSRAPEAVVEQERRKLLDARDEMAKLAANLESLGG